MKFRRLCVGELHWKISPNLFKLHCSSYGFCHSWWNTVNFVLIWQCRVLGSTVTVKWLLLLTHCRQSPGNTTCARGLTPQYSLCRTNNNLLCQMMLGGDYWVSFCFWGKLKYLTYDPEEHQEVSIAQERRGKFLYAADPS